MLFLSLCYMGVTCLRVIFADWAVQLLQTGWSLDAVGASSCILMLEAGGFVGSLVAGYASDTVFKGRRAPVISILGFLSAIPALLLMQGPGMKGGSVGKGGFGITYLPDFLLTGDYVPQVAFLMLGLFSFAPHVLIGLAAREWVHPKAGTSAHGLVSFIARVGGAAAGAPFGRYVQTQGWGGGMWLVVGMSLFSGFAMLPLWYKTAFRESSVGGDGKNVKKRQR
jgi:OPA family sugar phosphate sensor protein UhpC-like MFS transporter